MFESNIRFTKGIWLHHITTEVIYIFYLYLWFFLRSFLGKQTYMQWVRNFTSQREPGGEEEKPRMRPSHRPCLHRAGKTTVLSFDFTCTVSLINQVRSTSSVTQYLLHNAIPHYFHLYS